jgi:hypothetical protein
MALGLYPPSIDADVGAFLHDVQRYVACAVVTARASEFELCFIGSVHLASLRATAFVSNRRIVKLGHACVFRLRIGKSCEETYWLAPNAEATASEAADVSPEALGPAVLPELLQAVRTTTSRDATKRDFFTIRRFMIQAKQQRKILATCFAS